MSQSTLRFGPLLLVTIACGAPTPDQEVHSTLIDPGSANPINPGNPGTPTNPMRNLAPRYGRCGDGLLQLGEPCEDGNWLPGDGCFVCQVEPGWSCANNRCQEICGDGLIVGDERCDDGNTLSSDYCSSTCDSAGSLTIGTRLAQFGTLTVENYPVVFGMRADGALEQADIANQGLITMGPSPYAFAELYDGAARLSNFQIVSLRPFAPAAQAPSGQQGNLASQGAAHGCALYGFTPQCWGDNTYGQATPPLNSGPLTLVGLSVGDRYSCGLSPAGALRCWGHPDDAINPSATFSALSAEERRLCALRETVGGNELICWERGQLRMQEPGAYLTLSTARYHTCAIRQDRTLDCRASVPSTQHRRFNWPATDERFMSVSSFGVNTCGLREDGAVRCWYSTFNPG